MPAYVDSDRMERVLRNMKGLPGPQNRKRVFQRWGAFMVPRILDRARRNPATATVKVRFAANSEQCVVGSPTIWSRIHHFGGKIVPTGRTSEVTGKPIKHLAIPINAAAKKKQPRDFPKLRLLPLKSGAFLVQDSFNATDAKGKTFKAYERRSGAKTKVTRAKKVEKMFRFLFKLVPFVILKAKPYFFVAKDEAAELYRIIKFEAEQIIKKP